MKIFISCSGTRSRETAAVLSDWISQVIQAVEIWISVNVDKGSRSLEKLADQLETTNFGIICLDKDNLNSNWIMFEAGALSKTKDAHVCTFLLDVSPADIKLPLSQFQHTLFSKEEVKKLVQTINRKVMEHHQKSLSENALHEIYEHSWPRLESKLLTLKNTPHPIPSKSDREMLEVILQAVRQITGAGASISSLDALGKLLKESKNFKIDRESLRNYRIRYTYNDEELTKLIIESLLTNKFDD